MLVLFRAIKMFFETKCSVCKTRHPEIMDCPKPEEDEDG